MATQGDKKAIELRADGKKFGEIDASGGVLVIKKGGKTVTFDLRESARAGKAVLVGAKRQRIAT